MGSYLRPRAIEDALSLLAEGQRTILAGGTDYYPARVSQPLDDDILDISALPGLAGVTNEGGYLRIGALTRWSELVRSELPSAFDGLKIAARQVGGAQIQNAGTICGNVCNASPAADGIPNLRVLDAEIELRSIAGARRVPVADFVIGNRVTGRRADELVTAVLVPVPPETARSTFLKLGAREYLVISIAMVAALIVPAADGTVAEARIAVGACSPFAQRLPALEAALAGMPFDGDLDAVPESAHLAALSPIDDIRAAAEYRLDAVLTLLRRALRELGGGAA